MRQSNDDRNLSGGQISRRAGPEGAGEKRIREICWKTRRKFSAEKKTRILLEGLRGEYSIAAVCRREG
jgi:transposase